MHCGLSVLATFVCCSLMYARAVSTRNNVLVGDFCAKTEPRTLFAHKVRVHTYRGMVRRPSSHCFAKPTRTHTHSRGRWAPLFVSNDQLRDHKAGMSVIGDFAEWAETHIATSLFSTRRSLAHSHTQIMVSPHPSSRFVHLIRTHTYLHTAVGDGPHCRVQRPAPRPQGRNVRHWGFRRVGRDPHR